jgi:AraC family transcriptional regulator
MSVRTVGAPVPPSRDAFYSPVVRTRRTAAGVLTELHQPAPRRFPRHGHGRAYVSFLFAGSYAERCGALTLEHRPPTLAYHPPGFEHQDEVGATGGRFLIVELDPSWLDELAGGGPSAGGPRLFEGEQTMRAAWRLRRSLVEGADPDELTVEGLVLDLVQDLGRGLSGRERARPRWLARVIDCLRAEYGRGVSLRQVASEAGVHPAHLWRVFRRAEGCSPSTYVRRLRVHHVFRRLSEPDAPPLAGLALEAGFADQSHCTRELRRFLGVPPGALRRALSE